MFSERSGVVNIALEGIMVMGAFASIFFINRTQGVMSGQGQLILAILIAAGAGLVFSFFHAYAAVSLRSDQTISGTALNMFAQAIAIYMARTLQSNGDQQIQFTNTFFIQKVPVMGDIPILGRFSSATATSPPTWGLSSSPSRRSCCTRPASASAPRLRRAPPGGGQRGH